MKFATRFFLLMIIGLVDSLGVAQTTVQWRIEDGGNGHWYEAVYSNPPKSPESWFAFARENIRAHKRSAPINKIPPKTKVLTSYLKGAR